MGEAKRKRKQAERAEKGELAVYAPSVPRLRQITLTLDREIVEQIEMRHEDAAKLFPNWPPLDKFYWALLVGGIEMFDQELAAHIAHVAGESKPVDPTAPQPERLVLSPSEVPASTAKTLAKLHEANLMGGRG